MKAKDFDKKFDDGEVDIVQDLDMTTARRLDQRQRRVPVDLSIWMVASLDKEATRLGVTRQSIIKLWLAERLEQAAHKVSWSDDCFCAPG